LTDEDNYDAVIGIFTRSLADQDVQWPEDEPPEQQVSDKSLVYSNEYAKLVSYDI